MGSVVHRLRGGRRLWALAAVLVVVLLWRAETEWRRLQARYLDLRQEELAAELGAAREAAAEDLRFLEGEVGVAKDALADRALEVEEARERRRGLERRLREAERRLRRARARGDADAALAERITVEGLREQVTIAGEAVDALRADVLVAEAALDDALQPLDELAARLDAVDDLAFLRAIPGLRALAPGIHRREVRIDVGDAVPRVDRCVTCHLGAVGDVGGDAPEAGSYPVFAAHPRPDLYLAAASPHPYDEVGCTSCHGGDGRAVGTAAAGHGGAIRTGRQVESGCVSCHDGPWIAQGGLVDETVAETAGAGRRWATFLRCAACHETGRPDVELPGPSLVDLPRRMHPAWAARWIAEPATVRPTAWMPHLFDGVPEAERRAEVNALVTWLWHRAGEAAANETGEAPRDAPARPDAADDAGLLGDAERGEALWTELACAACHVRDAGARREDFLATPHRLRGPHLAGLADRYRDRQPALADFLEADFLGRAHPPDLHLDAGEARDLAAAILGEPTGPTELPPVDPEVRDHLLRERLRRVTTVEEADARMEGLGPAQRDLLLGELAVERYRCTACHQLPDPAPPPPQPGPSLRHVGLRPDLLPEDAATWPHGTKDPTLPRWRLSAEERRALAVQLEGWRPPPLGEARAAPTPDRGQVLLARHGCRACHSVAGRPLAGRPLAGSPGIEGVPPLDGVGARLRAGWIFDFLEDPEEHRVRPWLGVPMPGFRLSAGERSAIAEHFATAAGVPVLTPDPPPPDPADRALGAAVYGILQCDRCHPRNENGVEGPALPIPALAPDYRGSGERLRRPWLVAFLLDPPQDHPMPEIFPRRGLARREPAEPETGRDATYLLASLETPVFDVQRRRLERFYAGTEEMKAAFDDPHRVAEALADYMLSEDFASSNER